MSFYAKTFMYGEESSQFYNLQIANVDGGDSSNQGSGNIDVVEEFLRRRFKPYFYGISYSSKLVFPVTIFSENEIDAVSMSYIQYWLFGREQYQPLVLVESDMDDVYFNVIFTNPSVLRFGNIVYGFSADAVCDSQFAYTHPKTDTHNYTDQSVSDSITFYNRSHYRGYLYPSMTFTMNSSGSLLTIINTSDDDRQFSFTGIPGNEIVTIDNDRGIISSNLNGASLSNFNKNFLRFVPGTNVLTVVGNISQLTFTYQFARRLGG